MCRCHWWTRLGFTVAAVCCWFQAAGKIAPTTQDNSNGNRTTNRQARKKTKKKQQRNKSNEWNAKKKWWKSFNLCTLFETLYNKSCMQLTFVFDRYTVSCSCVFCCCCCCSQCFFPHLRFSFLSSFVDGGGGVFHSMDFSFGWLFAFVFFNFILKSASRVVANKGTLMIDHKSIAIFPFTPGENFNFSYAFHHLDSLLRPDRAQRGWKYRFSILIRYQFKQIFFMNATFS